MFQCAFLFLCFLAPTPPPAPAVPDGQGGFVPFTNSRVMPDGSPKDHAFASSRNEDAITSAGRKAVAAASAARALTITKGPRKRSANSSSRGIAKAGHVIPLKRS